MTGFFGRTSEILSKDVGAGIEVVGGQLKNFLEEGNIGSILGELRQILKFSSLVITNEIRSGNFNPKILFPIKIPDEFVDGFVSSIARMPDTSVFMMSGISAALNEAFFKKDLVGGVSRFRLLKAFFQMMLEKTAEYKNDD